MNQAHSPINGLWYCYVCEKEMNFTSKSYLNISNTHIHKKSMVSLLKIMKF